MDSDSSIKMDNTTATINPPSPPLTLTSNEQDPPNMAPRNKSLAPDTSATLVDWHGVSSICPSRWSMLPDRWSTVNNDHIDDLKAMISDAFAFRQVVDDSSSYPDEPTHTRAAADALRTLLMNPLLQTLHSNDIFKKVAKSPMKAKVRDWQDKRHSELVSIMEDFTTQVGHPSAPLSTFAAHGYSFSSSSSDHFLAARIRFLAAYERIYSTDQPLGEKLRKIRLPKTLFTTLEELQHIHHQKQGWIVKNTDADGGEDLRHSSFAVALWANQMVMVTCPENKMNTTQASKDNWASQWSTERKYNWWIPLTSSKTDMRVSHDMMVSHGITLFSAVLAYGTGPIELNEATRHIEHTVNLCMAHLEVFWQLTLAGIGDKDWDEKKKHEERQMRMKDAQYSMAICEQIRRDLEKARMSAPERVTRAPRRISEGAGCG